MTVGLYLLACHALGDFLLQTDRMAGAKFDNWHIRVEHCAVYTVSFLPVATLMEWSLVQGGVFATLLFTTHFVIDSRRWNDAVPIWYDQALHVIALAAVVAITGGVPA